MTFDPTNPDPSLTYVVGFSGGKDSVATYLYLRHVLKLPNIICIFSNTTHESVLTLFYLGILRDSHDVPLVFVQPRVEDVKGELKPHKILCRLRPAMADALGVTEDDDPTETDHDTYWGLVKRLTLTMENLSILKRRFPSSMVRFCTTFLKLIPQRRWMSANMTPGTFVRVAGVRSEESAARAKRPAFVPRDEVFDCPLWLPIKEWTHGEVFEIHHRFGVPPNPLYKHGMGRVGCWPCIMAKKSELAAISDRFPVSMQSLGDMERRVGLSTGKPAMSFFSHDKTPAGFHSETCPNTGKTFPVADDVRRWATNDTGQPLLPFLEDESEDAYTCSSQYGLCE